MKFLLKAAFWLTIVVLLLPSSEKNASAPQVGATEAVSAASAAVSDMRQFCTRQPEACAVGSQAAVTLGQKAQTGAKMLYDFLTDKVGPSETGSVTPKAEHTGSTAQPPQNTLTPEDMAPAWRGPELRKDSRRPA
jgi:hypothetical protein